MNDNYLVISKQPSVEIERVKGQAALNEIKDIVNIPILTELPQADASKAGRQFWLNGTLWTYARAGQFGAVAEGIPFSVFRLEGSQYFFAPANGTDIENAQQLQAAYNTAKTMSPSATNRITVIAAPGNYNFSSNLVINEEYIDLVSLDGNRSVVFNGNGSVSILANNVFVKGLNTLSKQIEVGSFLANTIIENCKGGQWSFGSFNANLISTFINCEGGDNSFASFDSAGGTFINCQGGNGSFAGNGGTALGVFTSCAGGDFSFGGEGGVASGTFNDCIGGNESFAGTNGIASGTASGTFINCEGGNGSFAAFGISSGTFTDCQGGNNSFGGGFSGNASGTFVNCIGGSASFGGNGGIASGTFNNCVGNNGSFGSSGTLSGKLYYCRLTFGTFQTLTGAGKIVLGIDGNDNIINLTA